MKPRAYSLYGMSRTGPFTLSPAAYGRGTHRWLYEVAAVSIPQAYSLAARGIWAKDARSVGVRRVYGPDGLRETAIYLARVAA